MSGQQAGLDRKNRLRQLAMESIDLKKDPYFMHNHIGMFECRLCGTTHPTEGNYLSHTQGRRHQTNMARRAAREAKSTTSAVNDLKSRIRVQKSAKIGRPGFKVIKQVDPSTSQKGILFEISFPDINAGLQPRHRMMSTYESRHASRDNRFQYLLFAAQPYETIGFKVPNKPLHQKPSTEWDSATKTFRLNLLYALPPNKSTEERKQTKAA